MQIVVLDAKSLRPAELDLSALKKLGPVSLYDRTPAELVTQRLRGADIVLTNKVKLDRQHILAAKNLKLISVLATGYDGVDVQAAAEKGVPVCNVPGYATHGVAQAAFALLLELVSHTGCHNEKIRRGAWVASPDFCWWEKTPVSLFGKTFGVIGCGAIGRETAKIASAFGMDVIGCNPHQYEGFPGRYVSLEELLSRADVISLHCPANAETVGMINEETIARMKTGVYLVNTARGSLVEEADVKDALESGKIAGYAADVLSREPADVHNPILSAPNCVFSAHCAWAYRESRQKIVDVTADNISAFMEGRPENAVNMPLKQ